MIKWRARIGLLYPADGDLDYEIWRFLPDAVSVHITRTPAPEGELTITNVSEIAESPDLENAASMLATIQLDAIAFLCTAASFIGGPGYDKRILHRIERSTGLPATTTSTALIEAFRFLRVKRPFVIAPYPISITERLVQFLNGSGFEVVGFHTMSISRGIDIGQVSPNELMRCIRRVNSDKADAIFISCSALSTFEILESLEQDLGKPVLSAIQVTLWHSLILAGVQAQMPISCSLSSMESST